MYTMPPLNPEVARIRRKSALRKYQKRLRKVKLLWAGAAILLLVLLCEGLFAVSFSPRFWIYRINVLFNSEHTLSESEVVTLLNLPAEQNYFRTSPGSLEARVRRDPRVRNVVVQHGKVGVLVVNVTERTPVCRLDGTAQPLYVDKDGVLFPRPTAPGLPVPLVQGMKLPAPEASLLGHPLDLPAARSALACLRALSDERRDFPAEDVALITIDAHGQITLGLREGTKVLIGNENDLPDKAWAAGQMVQEASTAGYSLDKLASIDVRYINVQTDPSQVRRIMKGACYTPIPLPGAAPPNTTAPGGVKP